VHVWDSHRHVAALCSNASMKPIAGRRPRWPLISAPTRCAGCHRLAR